MTDRFSAFLAGAGLQLRRMDDEHLVDFFDCGRDAGMDKWFCQTAMKWQREDMCAVWVLSPADNATDPLGFFTLSAHQVIPGNVDKCHRAADASNKSWVNNLRQPFPAQLLGKFALDGSQQGKGLGAILMTCVYAKHVEAADVAGAKFLVVDVREDDLVTYYSERFGFERSGLIDEMAQMYRPTWVVREDLNEALKLP
ncbi:hypothetical protein [Gordonia sp. (in: high G+C Gram-positive bacteria)]|uniref:hypothetical protein n=1 Tax=Gordonia sp. (in: high G+C Gram-positive bacteria) TaxID=84139 RepID=UPI0039E2D6E4